METSANSALRGPVHGAGRTFDLAWLPSSGVALEERPDVAVARAAARSLYEALAAQAEAGRPCTLAQRIRVHAPHAELAPPLPAGPGALPARPGLPAPRAWRTREAWLAAPAHLAWLAGWARAALSGVPARLAWLSGLPRRHARRLPTLVFQPVDGFEVSRALAWACARGMPVRTHGRFPAPGPIPGPGGGLALDMSLAAAVGVDPRRREAFAGAGATVAAVQEKLAGYALSLRARPPGNRGTVGSWLASGLPGQGLFAHGTGPGQVRWLEAVLPQGLHLRVHQDGALDLLDEPLSPAIHLDPAQAAGWCADLGLPPLRPADLAARPGVIVSAMLELGAARPVQPHLVPFDSRDEALRFAQAVAEEAERTGRLPLDLEYRSDGTTAPDGPPATTGGRVHVDFDEPGAEELLQAAAFSERLRPELAEHARQALANRWSPAPDCHVLAEARMETSRVPGALEAATLLGRRARTPVEFEVRYQRRGLAQLRVTSPARGPLGTAGRWILKTLLARRLAHQKGSEATKPVL